MGDLSGVGCQTASMAKILIMLILFLLLAAIGLSRLAAVRPVLDAGQQQQQEVLYLPSGKGLELLSFGYRALLADILWFRTVSYFGKHYRSDQHYRWLDHMCNLVTSLDGKAAHIYEFCSLMLAWEAGMPRESVALMDKAIQNDPDNWRYYYLRGMNYAFFLGDAGRARADFATGAGKPRAIALLARLAAKQLALDDPQTALRFLENMVEQARDENQRAAMPEHYKKALHEVNLEALNRAVADYLGAAGRYPRSIQQAAEALRRPLPLRDPFGGEYFIDPQTHEARSTSKVQRIQFLKEKQP